MHYFILFNKQTCVKAFGAAAFLEAKKPALKKLQLNNESLFHLFKADI